jgi:beta-lactamase regulating signal transducer with metallopeptidase domain
MMNISISPEIMQKLAGSLLHFFWEGAVVAMMTALSLRLLSRRSAEARYAVSVAGLLLMAMAPILTFAAYAQTGRFAERILQILGKSIAAAGRASVQPDTALWIRWIVIVWLAGVIVCLVRLGIAWLLSCQLVHSATLSVPPAVTGMFDWVKQQLKLRRVVRLRVSARIGVPAVVGWLRPRVLLPVSAITGLDEDQLRAVFVHELAHIRRHDFLVNTLQRCLESVLFYHPAVWWLSARTRVERERCCDDLAVRICGDPLVYAQALIELERVRRSSESALAVAATGGPLTQRIHRILGRESANRDWQSAAVALMFVLAWIVAGLLHSTTLEARTSALPSKPAESLAKVVVGEAPPAQSPVAGVLNSIAAIVTAKPIGESESIQAPIPIGATPQSPALSSIEGIVVKRGTSEPIAGVDLELDRVEGTPAAPLGRGVAEAFASILFSTGQGLPAQGSTPPALLAPEVKYAKSGSDGRFTFKDLKEGKYRLAAVRSGGMYYPVEYGQRDLKQRGLSFPVAAGQAKKDVKIEMSLTGVISGRVVDEDRQPMGHVVVMALTAQFQAGEQRSYIERTVLTDERGDYRIYWLGPGKYSVAAVIEDPQRRTIDMAPTAPPGRTIARHRATSPVVTRQVLPDGNVIEEAYGVVYYGGVLDPKAATPVEVHSGETFAGADISIGVGKMRTHHLQGTVINGETGQPTSGAHVLAIPRQESPNALVLTGTSNANGVFDLAGALPDGYILTAEALLPTTARIVPGAVPSVELFVGRSSSSVGYVSVDVGNSDATNIRIVTTSGFTLSGHVVIEGKSASDAESDLVRMNVDLIRDPDLIAMPSEFMPLPPPPPGTPRPAVLPPGNGQVTSNGDFKMLVSPGDFRVYVDRLPANTYVKSIRMGGEDLLRSGFHITKAEDNAIQIVIGTDGGTISGSVVDETLGPFLNATVALVPGSPDLRGRSDLYRNTTTDSTGNFQFTAIPPGSYKLFAWDWAEPDSWESADFIRAYESLGKTMLVTASGREDKVQLNVIQERNPVR